MVSKSYRSDRAVPGLVRGAGVWRSAFAPASLHCYVYQSDPCTFKRCIGDIIAFIAICYATHCRWSSALRLEVAVPDAALLPYHGARALHSELAAAYSCTANNVAFQCADAPSHRLPSQKWLVHAACTVGFLMHLPLCDRCRLQVLMFPLDVANRKSCSASVVESACNLTMPMETMWQAVRPTPGYFCCFAALFTFHQLDASP